MKSILILSNTSDYHSDLLVSASESRGFRCFRWNTDLERDRGRVWSDFSGDSWIGNEHQKVRVSDLDLVFVRRPTRAYSLRHGDWLSQMLDDEWQSFECGFTYMGHPRLVNPPAASVLARNKLVQMRYAANAGLRIPETIITNCRESLLQFAEGREVISKAVSYGSVDDGEYVRTGYTRTVSSKDIRNTREFRSPTLLQQRVAPVAMWRIVTIGHQTYSFRLTGPELQEAEDSRFVETKLSGAFVETPEVVRTGLLNVCQLFGICYASSDFIEDSHGSLFFIDLNPEGQWAHYEKEFGVPLSERLVELAL